ncbi:MAG: hypothetical protein HUU47_09835, partial [Bacteroidetes bacterium]|nr:hypothetical protein [Bacteroidota bacterium]
MIKFKFLILFLIFNFYSEYIKSQNFKWLKTFGTINELEIIKGVSSVSDSEIVCFFEASQGQILQSDTLQFDSIKFQLNPNSQNFNYIVKLNKNGKVTNAKSIGNIMVNSTCSDEYGNFYIGGTIKNNGSIVDTFQLKKSKGKAIVVKFDKYFNVKWITQLGNDSSSSISKLVYSQKHLYFVGFSKDSTIIDTSKYNFGKFGSSFFGELNESNGNFLWSNYLIINKSLNCLIILDLVSLKNKLFFVGENYRYSNGTKIKSDTFYSGSGFVIKADSFGNYEKRILLKSKSTVINCISTDGNLLYIGGKFIDTLLINSNKISPEYNKGSDAYELFTASISSSLNSRWFFRPLIIEKSVKNTHVNNILKISCSNGYTYFGGQFTSKILIDSNLMIAKNGDLLLLKFDSIGNILWAANGNSLNFSGIRGLDAIAVNSVFVTGYFNDTITFGKFKKSSKGGMDGFITKITDYSITRGKVSPGPYCAGDTILIPYSKFGDFDSANTFYAQLSDENGN